MCIRDSYYADLGGTDCMCDLRWSVTEYWRKTFSSYAFNLAHLLGNTNLAIMTYSGTNSMFLVLMVFVNEFVEEMLVATTARWGFAADPPSDSEPRYDSLIRDVICSCLGVYVGITISKAFRCKPVVRGPPGRNIVFSRKAGWRGIIGYRSDPHSVVRWLNWVVQWHAMNTIIIGTYNTDAGIYKWNKANIVMILIYPATIAAFCCYHLHQGTWAELPRQRVIQWHCAWAACGCFIISFVLYPIWKSALYLVMCAEVSVTAFIDCIVTYLRVQAHRDTAVTRSANASDDPSAPRVIDVEVLTRRLREVADSGGRVDAESVKQTVDELATIKPDAADADKRPPMQQSDWIWFAVRNAIRLCILMVAIQQPFLWEGPQYRRHWCGNPAALEGNTCTGPHGEAL